MNKDKILDDVYTMFMMALGVVAVLFSATIAIMMSIKLLQKIELMPCL